MKKKRKKKNAEIYKKFVSDDLKMKCYFGQALQTPGSTEIHN